MGAAVDAFRKGFEEAKEKCIDSMSGQLEAACKEAHQEIREDIVHNWGPFNYWSTDFATLYEPSMTINKNKMTCTVHSYIEPGMFYPLSDTTAIWQQLHPDVSCQPGNLYILDLLLHKGIIGLPADSTVSGWVNPNFRQAPNGLEDEILTSPKWEKFGSLVKSKLK